VSKCRRCSECRERSHHWMPNPDFGNDPDEAEGPVDVDYICKHCDATASECRHCFGDGYEPGIDDAQPCSVCDGEGVIFNGVGG